MWNFTKKHLYNNKKQIFMMIKMVINIIDLKEKMSNLHDQMIDGVVRTSNKGANVSLTQIGDIDELKTFKIC